MKKNIKNDSIRTHFFYLIIQYIRAQFELMKNLIG
jgi:hypothetical protein